MRGRKAVQKKFFFPERKTAVKWKEKLERSSSE